MAKSKKKYPSKKVYNAPKRIENTPQINIKRNQDDVYTKEYRDYKDYRDSQKPMYMRILVLIMVVVLFIGFILFPIFNI